MSGKTGSAKLIAGAAIAVAVAGFAGWKYHQSPNQVAARQLEQATRAQAEGHVLQAAELYASVAQSQADVAPKGASGLKGLLSIATLQALPAAEAAQVLQQAQSARKAGQSPMPPKDLATLGWTLVAQHADQDAAGAKAVLDAIKPLETDKTKWSAAAEPLLERIVAADPGQAPAAIELAELLDQRHDCARCEALLAPHAAKLGKTEAARILGQTMAAKGRLDESYALLQPYTEEKLKAFVKQQADYEALVTSIENAAIETLRSNKAPAAFYKQYEAADEAGKRQLVSTFVDEQASHNGALTSSMQKLRESAAIVPVALDLGIVTVQRAQALTDTTARNAQFQAAEKVFLSIRGVVGNTDSYRLYLGQVYYWLGKQAEGRKLFDELLDAHQRAPGVMVEVAGVLRSVGSVPEARAMAEEAHRKASDNNQRWTAAHLRSVMMTDAEDQLAWLERCDPSQARIRAALHTTRAQIAQRKGQRVVARREYEAAADEMAKLPESATQLNSSALIHLALYSMEGDAKHRDAGLAQLDQALALEPADSVLLMNNVAAVSTASAAAIVGDRIDLPALRMAGSYQFTEFLYDDEASQARVRQTIRENEAVKKGLAYSDKLAMLAPRSPDAYSFPSAIAVELDDVQAMKAIATRATAAKVDAADNRDRLRKLADGTDLKKYVEQVGAHVKEASVLMEQPAVQRSPITWAVAAGEWVDGQLILGRWGQPIDVESVVKVSRKARAASPSAGTLTMLLRSLEARASQRLAKAQPAYAASVARHGRLVDLSTLMMVHGDEDAEFRRLLLADPDMVEVMGLLRERDRRFPDKSTPSAFLLFQHADPAYAQTLSGRLKKDAGYDAYYEMREAIDPLHPESIIRQVHYALAIGDRAKAQRLLEAARKNGVELPELLGRQFKA